MSQVVTVALRVRPLHGSVAFYGTQRDAYRACLWSRVATRIQLVLARVPAANADELYENAAAFPWEKHVRDGATIAIDAHGTSTSLRNTQFTALKVKDALCDRLREVRGVRPDVDAKDPDVSVSVNLRDDRATLLFNLSGASLHRRGYREEGVQTEAPLKETLAGGILLAAGWDALATERSVLVDPMCGSGTFSIEAALIAADVAPGILRTRWGFEGWVRHDRQVWDELLQEAEERRACAVPRARIVTGDMDERAVAVARANAERAGVESLVRPFVDDAAHVARHLRGTRGMRGLMVANPPYGLRLLSQDDLPQVNSALAEAVEALPRDWRVALITPDVGVDTALGRVPEDIIACYNGPLETWVRLYDLGEARQTLEVVSLAGTQRVVPLGDAASSQLAGRLRKVGKERARWARRAGVSCYRVYDADLPDYPLSVDLFDGVGPDEGQRYLVVEEYPRPRSVDAQRAGRHFADAVVLAAAIFDVELANVVQKPWQSDALYARTRDAHSAEHVLHVSEDGLVFAHDLMGAVGKGIALDQRELRVYVRAHARGARVANLFATANAASVLAAAGGARSTVTVDVSQERLAWVAQALADNGLAGKSNATVRMDARAWLEREVKTHHAHDLVLCAPPMSLAAHGAKGRAWELAHDLGELLALVGRVLAREGTALLLLPAGSTLEGAMVAKAGLVAEDASASLAAHDFGRSRTKPSFYLLRRK